MLNMCGEYLRSKKSSFIYLLLEKVKKTTINHKNKK